MVTTECVQLQLSAPWKLVLELGMLFRHYGSPHCPARPCCVYFVVFLFFPALISKKYMMLKTCQITQTKQRLYAMDSSHH